MKLTLIIVRHHQGLKYIFLNFMLLLKRVLITLMLGLGQQKMMDG